MSSLTSSCCCLPSTENLIYTILIASNMSLLVNLELLIFIDNVVCKELKVIHLFETWWLINKLIVTFHYSFQTLEWLPTKLIHRFTFHSSNLKFPDNELSDNKLNLTFHLQDDLPKANPTKPSQALPTKAKPSLIKLDPPKPSLQERWYFISKMIKPSEACEKLLITLLTF